LVRYSKKINMSQQKNLNLVFLLDDSGSMSSVESKVKGIVPKVFEQLENNNVSGQVSLYTLNGGKDEIAFSNLKNRFYYEASGATPLYSCLIRAIKDNEKKNPNLLLILSDGRAEDSVYREECAVELEKFQKDHPNCSVCFIVEGQDAINCARNLGVFNTLNFTKSDMNMLGTLIHDEIMRAANTI